MEQTKFGTLAVAAGYLTADRLERAQRLQEEDAREGRVPRPIGIICLQLGLMSFKQVDITLERAERQSGRPGGRGFRARQPVSRARTESLSSRPRLPHSVC